MLYWPALKPADIVLAGRAIRRLFTKRGAMSVYEEGSHRRRAECALVPGSRRYPDGRKDGGRRFRAWRDCGGQSSAGAWNVLVLGGTALEVGVVFHAHSLDQVELRLQPVDMFLLAFQDVPQEVPRHIVADLFAAGDPFP